MNFLPNFIRTEVPLDEELFYQAERDVPALNAKLKKMGYGDCQFSIMSDGRLVFRHSGEYDDLQAEAIHDAALEFISGDLMALIDLGAALGTKSACLPAGYLKYELVAAAAA